MQPNPISQRPHRRSRSAGFTLIEMMVVIGIIGILTALTGVALRGFNGSTSRHTAVNTLMGVFDQARMVAISDGRPTYVVFVSAPRGQQLDTTVFPDEMWGRAYALFEDPVLTDSITAANQFLPTQRSSWLYLPTGIAFKCDNTSDSAHASVTDTPRDGSDTTGFAVISRSTNQSVTPPPQLPYVKFDATGQVVYQNGSVVDATSSKLHVLLFEGLASKVSVETHTHPPVGSTADTKKYALDEIILKSTTGRAEYTVDPVNNLASNTTTP